MPETSTRSARCPLHGRIYDSWSGAGCPDCAGGRRARAPGAGRRLLLLALAVAGGALLGQLTRLGVGLANRVEAEHGSVPRPAPARLDPTPYRAGIEAIEAVLYQDGKTQLGDADRVGAAARALGEHLAADPGREAGERAHRELLGFAAATEAREEAGYALPGLAGPRREWQRLRATLFEPADWLRREAPRLAAAQQPAPPRADWLDVEAALGFADSLDPLVASGRREMMRFGEPSVDVAERSAEERQLVADWLAFARGWDERVSKVCAKAPPAPALDDDLRLVMAHQLLAQACQQLRVATFAAGDLPVPMKDWRQGALEQAGAHVAEARARLAEAKAF